MVNRAEVTHFGGVSAANAEPGPHAVQTLEAEIRRLQQRVQVEIPQEIATAEIRMAEARGTLAATADRIEEIRTVRQARLADGADVAGLTRQIADIRGEHDLAEDLAQGLAAKVAVLNKENLRIQTEDKPRLQRELLELSIQPLVDAYNEAAARLAQITEAVYRRMTECGQGFGPSSVGTVWVSGQAWEAFQTVPRLCRPGADGQHFFHYPWFADRFQRELRAAEQA